MIDAVLICYLNVVLFEVGPAEEDYSILPLVAYPTFTSLGAGPLGGGMRSEVRILAFLLGKDELRVAELACDDEWLHTGMPTTKTTLHIAFKEVTVLLHVSNLDRVSNLSSCVFISVDHLSSFIRFIIHDIIEFDLLNFILFIYL